MKGGMQGVLVACDKEQEWMLKWWWFHYSKHNRYPVVFVDLGMSQEIKEWCRQKGQLAPLVCPKDLLIPKHLVPKEQIEAWEKICGDIPWDLREPWFRKPFAMLQTPFECTIWTDLDCEITGSLTPLFQKAHTHSGIGVARERRYTLEEAGYNSGVIVYQKESPVLIRWAEKCHRHNDQYLGDQDVLSDIINTENLEITELPDIYNWRMKFGVNFEAVIIHWCGRWGKEIIRRAVQNPSQAIFG